MANRYQKWLGELRPGGLCRRYVSYIRSRGRIAGGIFGGMRYVHTSVCGENIPKWLGVYEIELRPALESLLSVPFTSIIIVGAAEGYYAVGCALLWPSADVTAFEATAAGRELLEQVTQMNGVTNRVRVRGVCNRELLLSAIDCSQPTLIIMDVEGGEQELLGPGTSDAMSQSHVVVEIHDCRGPAVGENIASEFVHTHDLEEISARKRVWSDFEVPRFKPLRRYMLRGLIAHTNERPLPMRWFVMHPKMPAPPVCHTIVGSSIRSLDK